MKPMQKLLFAMMLFAAALSPAAAEFEHPAVGQCITGSIQTCTNLLSHASLSDRERSRLFVYRAIKFALARKTDAAMTDLAKAIELDRTNATAWQVRCSQRARWNIQIEEALNDCNEAIRINAGVSSHYTSRGQVLLRLGRLDDAIANFDRALTINPHDPFSRYLRGVAFLRKGDRAVGQRDISRVRNSNPDIVELLAGFGFK